MMPIAYESGAISDRPDVSSRGTSALAWLTKAVGQFSNPTKETHMLVVPTAIHGYDIEAQDGAIGTVVDFLFDDRSWQCRWVVVDTGDWLNSRKILLHPSALGIVDHDQKYIPVELTRQKVEGSPGLSNHKPVSMQAETAHYEYYGWDPFWGSGLYGYSDANNFSGPPRYFGDPELVPAARHASHDETSDPHLRSISEVTNYGVHATDGDIGHVENMLVDDESWGVRYLIIDTSNWWFGTRVLISPFSVREIRYEGSRILLTMTKAVVKGSPAWDPLNQIEREEQKRLHAYYGWPGYGW